MDIMEQIEVIKIYNKSIKRSQSFLYNVLDWTFSRPYAILCIPLGGNSLNMFIASNQIGIFYLNFNTLIKGLVESFYTPRLKVGNVCAWAVCDYSSRNFSSWCQLDAYIENVLWLTWSIDDVMGWSHNFSRKFFLACKY